MLSRCSNPSSISYPNYGGRGIAVCNEWKDYITFKQWALKNGFAENLTIERIDINGDYCPENVTFISNFDQHSNRRDNITCMYHDNLYTAAQLSRELNIPEATVGSWIKEGKDISTQLKLRSASSKKILIEFKGKAYGVKPLANLLSVPVDTVYGWIYSGKDIEHTYSKYKERKRKWKING